MLYTEEEVKCNQKECKEIIEGKKITDLKKIPYMLKDQFQDRICGISKKPIYTAVIIRESADSEPIYYDWSNLVKAITKGKVPKNWPTTVPFVPAAAVVDDLGTKNIEDRLKKAALKPNIVGRAQAALTELNKQKESLKAIKALNLEDMIGMKIDEEYIKLADRSQIKKVLKTQELRRD